MMQKKDLEKIRTLLPALSEDIITAFCSDAVGMSYESIESLQKSRYTGLNELERSILIAYTFIVHGTI